MWRDSVDIDSLVEGGASGLTRLASSLRQAGVPLRGLYIIRLDPEDSESRVDWVLRLVVPRDADRRAPILEAIYRRRAGELPELNQKIRLSSISESDREVVAIRGLAAERRQLPTVIDSAMSNGLIIDYAFVSELDGVETVAA